MDQIHKAKQNQRHEDQTKAYKNPKYCSNKETILTKCFYSDLSGLANWKRSKTGINAFIDTICSGYTNMQFGGSCWKPDG